MSQPRDGKITPRGTAVKLQGKVIAPHFGETRAEWERRSKINGCSSRNFGSYEHPLLFQKNSSRQLDDGHVLNTDIPCSENSVGDWDIDYGSFPTPEARVEWERRCSENGISDAMLYLGGYFDSIRDSTANNKKEEIEGTKLDEGTVVNIDIRNKDVISTHPLVSQANTENKAQLGTESLQKESSNETACEEIESFTDCEVKLSTKNTPSGDTLYTGAGIVPTRTLITNNENEDDEKLEKEGVGADVLNEDSTPSCSEKFQSDTKFLQNELSSNEIITSCEVIEPAIDARAEWEKRCIDNESSDVMLCPGGSIVPTRESTINNRKEEVESGKLDGGEVVNTNIPNDDSIPSCSNGIQSTTETVTQLETKSHPKSLHNVSSSNEVIESVTDAHVKWEKRCTENGATDTRPYSGKDIASIGEYEEKIGTSDEGKALDSNAPHEDPTERFPSNSETGIEMETKPLQNALSSNMIVTPCEGIESVTDARVEWEKRCTENEATDTRPYSGKGIASIGEYEEKVGKSDERKALDSNAPHEDPTERFQSNSETGIELETKPLQNALSSNMIATPCEGIESVTDARVEWEKRCTENGLSDAMLNPGGYVDLIREVPINNKMEEIDGAKIGKGIALDRDLSNEDSSSSCSTTETGTELETKSLHDKLSSNACEEIEPVIDASENGLSVTVLNPGRTISPIRLLTTDHKQEELEGGKSDEGEFIDVKILNENSILSSSEKLQSTMGTGAELETKPLHNELPSNEMLSCEDTELIQDSTTNSKKETIHEKSTECKRSLVLPDEDTTSPRSVINIKSTNENKSVTTGTLTTLDSAEQSDGAKITGDDPIKRITLPIENVGYFKIDNTEESDRGKSTEEDVSGGMDFPPQESSQPIVITRSTKDNSIIDLEEKANVSIGLLTGVSSTLCSCEVTKSSSDSIGEPEGHLSAHEEEITLCTPVEITKSITEESSLPGSDVNKGVPENDCVASGIETQAESPPVTIGTLANDDSEKEVICEVSEVGVLPTNQKLVQIKLESDVVHCEESLRLTIKQNTGPLNEQEFGQPDQANDDSSAVESEQVQVTTGHCDEDRINITHDRLNSSNLSQAKGLGDYGLYLPRGYKLVQTRVSMPDGSKVREYGYALTRMARPNIVFKKKWEQSYWVRYGESSLYIFRSKEAFDEWLTNSKISKKQINSLLKHRLVFSEDMRKDSSIHGYTCTDIKSKIIKTSTKKWYSFKVKISVDRSVREIAAFASESEEDTNVLRDSIDECLANCPRIWSGDNLSLSKK